MIIVTGGAGFIGSNLVHGLKANGYEKIIVVDDLTDGRKFGNLLPVTGIVDYLDKDDFLDKITNDHEFGGKIEAVFHQGACSTTTEWDGKYMLKNNYEYSKILFHYCLKREIPFIYASSAAVYGQSTNFSEIPENENPLNVYGFSKLLFDQYLRNMEERITIPVIGLRYFNVYGKGEQHKGSQASVAWHLHNQFLVKNKINLFVGSHGYGNGEQRRDFVSVSDIVDVNIWCWQNIQSKGLRICNVGTGTSRNFNDIARVVLSYHNASIDKIEYIPFPDKLLDSYQSFTEADISALRALGYDKKFVDIEEGVENYLKEITN